MKISSPEKLARVAKEMRDRLAKYKTTVSVCGGTGCRAGGCMAVADAVEAELDKRKLTKKVRLLITGCHGFCERGPIIVIRPGDIFYSKIKPEWVSEIIEETVVNGRPLEKFLYKPPGAKEPVTKEQEVPFYAVQERPLLRSNSHIDPTDIGDYIALGGYTALAKALFTMNADEIIGEVRKSGLRGRGGGGFPTGRKWESCRKADGDHHWVICNADEGDPGAFMDESILEGNPHLVVEGMIIGAFAVGSSAGYVYVRNEYPLALRQISNAIEQARECGLLGKNILGGGFDFDIHINRGGGAFVCGESTALMASLEGKVGEPRAKYIHTVEHGYHDEPTVLNNVETWANIPRIVLDGADSFRALGTEGSPGTKIFSLVGKVINTGLVEIPMGMSLRQLVEEIGGGIPDKKKFKAVQTGGPSGGCIPEEHLDLPVDFDALTGVGSMMGSGGLIVMDEDTCMVDVARFFIRFLKEESCGKCTPCREGLQEMDRVLTGITDGLGAIDDLDYLEELGQWMKDASLCGLGQTAPNPVLSTIRYFRDEYLGHIQDGKCPGGVCRELLEFVILADKCTGCGACVKVCPAGAITGELKKVHNLDSMLCIRCGACYQACRFDAIER
jgi:NADH-quinone oxidoreductase subunit F